MKTLFLTSLSALALMTALPVNAAQDTNDARPAASRDANAAADVSAIRNEAEFRAALGMAGNVSLMSARTGVDKASDDMVKDFAKFEVAEQETIAAVLKELDTPAPMLADQDKAMLDQLKSTAKGPEFDRMFMQGQLDTHEKLRDICETYLDHSKNAKGDKADMNEREARHLAMVALATIKEHIAMSKKMLGKMPQ